MYQEAVMQGKVACDLLASMTGYGRGEAETENHRVVIEIKSVNNRFLEVVTRLPRQLAALEDKIKKQAQSVLKRGRIDIFVSFEQINNKRPPIAIDNALAMEYYNLLLGLSQACCLPEDINIGTLLSLPGVVSQLKEEEFAEDAVLGVERALALALENIADMRQREGEGLKEDLLKNQTALAEMMRQIDWLSPLVVEEYRVKLSSRIEALLHEAALDETRLANEVAFLADKADISEELARMQSHLGQFTQTLSLPEPMGRKLDFIVQEMNREINTIGSKANHLEITSLVIEAKSVLEKIREQIQNIE